MKTLKVLDFSETPLLRYCTLSDFSGELFYHTKLNEQFAECYQKKECLCLDLDGVSGYAPSFLDEAVGCLVYDFSAAIVSEYLKVKTEDEPDWVDFLNEETYPKWEARRKNRKEPTVTKHHSPWWRIEKNELKKDIWSDV